MELNSILQQIDELKKEAEKLQPAKAEFEKTFWDKFRLEFNYNSNHLEGNTLTYGHTQLLLIFDKVGADYTGREIEEMKAHDLAWKIVKEAAVERDHVLTEKFIREINELILVRPFYKEAITSDGQPTRRLIEPGQYKKYPNSVRLENGEIFNYANPEETPALMGELLEWYRKESQTIELHPVQLAALFHYRFIRIHPFDDSNGRTSRLMMNYILMRFGYAPAVIDSSDKKNYLTALNKADAGDVQSFILYIAQASNKWQTLFLKAKVGEKIEEEGDFEKEITLLKQNLSNHNKIQTKFSPSKVVQLFEISFEKLFKICVDKLSQLDSFFYEKEFVFQVGSFTGPVYEIFQIRELLIDKKHLLELNTSIQFIHRHRGLRTKNNTVFEYESKIMIGFSEYKYNITSPSNRNVIPIWKFYNEVPDDHEMTEIATSLAKRELEQIKRQIEKQDF